MFYAKSLGEQRTKDSGNSTVFYRHVKKEISLVDLEASFKMEIASNY